MAKRKVLNTTVYATDPETGQVERWDSGRKLSAAEAESLGWPDDHESWDDDLDEDMSQEEAVATGHPMADRIRAAAQDEAGVPDKERTGKGVSRK
jgi:hypothetical protein